MSEHHHLCPMMVTRFSKKKITLDFDNWVTKLNSGIGMKVMQEGR